MIANRYCLIVDNLNKVQRGIATISRGRFFKNFKLYNITIPLIKFITVYKCLLLFKHFFTYI